MLICLTLWKCDSKKAHNLKKKNPPKAKRRLVWSLQPEGVLSATATTRVVAAIWAISLVKQSRDKNWIILSFYIIVNDCWLHETKTKHSRKVFLAKVTNLGSSSVWPRPLGELERRELAGRQPCSHRGWGHRPHGGGRGGAGPETFGCSVRNKSLIFGIDALQTLLHLSLSLSLLQIRAVIRLQLFDSQYQDQVVQCTTSRS